MIYIQSTKIGKIGIEIDGDFIIHLYFENALANLNPAKITKIPKDLHLQAFKQIDEYFEKSRKQFDLPIRLDVTPFQAKVLAQMQQIGYGKVATYKDLAVAVGSPNGSRAVGGACNKNPIAIIVPCHRVVGSNHSLTGFAGGLSVKTLLLELEGVEL